MTTEEITITKRFCGPPDSGNGGYVSGMIARYVDGVAEVTLRKPPPLDQSMSVEQDGDTVRLMLDTDCIAEAKPSALELNIPQSPTFAEAENAVQRYTGFEDHAFPTCFVCGPDREEGDALRIFAGSVGSDGTVAAPWTPHASLADDGGNVSSEYVWAALDCPGAFAVGRFNEIVVVLGRLTVEQYRPVACGEPHIATAWPIAHEGRKYFAGTAVYTADGECCAAAKATWIAIESAKGETKE